MTTDARPGFRLPWAAGTAESTGADETDEQTTTGDAPVAEEAQEADMIDTTDTSAATPEPATEPEAAPTPPARRATKFMAELSRAMQVAAENARAETMARFETEAKGVVEAIHATATDEAADLRRKADDDVATIRDWSKAEIARIREETETRIAARKVGLEGEVEQHAATVEARIERVTAVVGAFETQMAAFFERLNAEEDPTRIATMAETMPDPPSLADVAASIASTPTAQAAEAPVADRPTDLFGDIQDAESPADAVTASEIDFAAAEAEAASFSGDLESEDLAVAEDGADSVAVEDPGASVDEELAPNADLASSRVVVTGLVSVANIANFKRSLARTPGVSTIAVASGPDGDFVFTVSHTLGSALSASVQALPGFDIQITGESDDAINVAAQDRDATD